MAKGELPFSAPLWEGKPSSLAWKEGGEWALLTYGRENIDRRDDGGKAIKGSKEREREDVIRWTGKVSEEISTLFGIHTFRKCTYFSMEA